LDVPSEIQSHLLLYNSILCTHWHAEH
jgi:hypothetical protein